MRATTVLYLFQLAAVPWYALPTVTDLHAVRMNHGREYYGHFIDKLSGQSASPLYREPLAELHTHYALMLETGQAPTLDENEREEVRSAFSSSASMALEAWFLETIRRSDDIDTTLRIARTAFSPNLQMEKTDAGWKTTVNQGNLSSHPDLHRREESAALTRTSPRNRVFQLGSGLRTYTVEHANQDDETRWDATLYARWDNFWLQNTFITYRVVSESWRLTTRKKLTQDLTANMLLESRSEAAIPGRWGSGLSWTLPHHPHWTLLFKYRQDIPIPPRTFRIKRSTNRMRRTESPLAPSSRPATRNSGTARSVKESYAPSIV